MYYLYVDDRKQRVTVAARPVSRKAPTATYRNWRLAMAAARHIADRKDYILEWDPAPRATTISR